MTQEMFDKVGVNKDVLHRSLLRMGKTHLKKEMKDSWSPDNVTRGYCYVVSEMVYHYFNDGSLRPFILTNIPDEPISHRYLMSDDMIIDLTGDQFKNKTINYSLGKPSPFMWVKGGGPSKRTVELKRIYDEESSIG